jgi:hypothetical protein
MVMFSVALLLGGCAPPPYTPDVVDTRPRITITWPLPESTAAGCVIATVDVENFTLVAPGGSMDPGVGHYHLLTPAGYDTCYAPYCIADFTSMQTDQQGELRALLVDSQHQAVLDENGDPYESSILFNYEASPDCAMSGGAAHYDTGDTGGHDTGT